MALALRAENPAAWPLVTRASVRVEDLFVKIMRQMIIKGRWRAEPDAALN
jgi:hypothetical protein